MIPIAHLLVAVKIQHSYRRFSFFKFSSKLLFNVVFIFYFILFFLTFKCTKGFTIPILYLRTFLRKFISKESKIMQQNASS